jgi:hypothetical protein
LRWVLQEYPGTIVLGESEDVTTESNDLLLTDQKRNYPGDGPLWVNYSPKNGAFRDFVWPGTTPPPHSVVLDCYHKGTSSTLNVQETWEVKGRLRTWVVQAAKSYRAQFIA